MTATSKSVALPASLQFGRLVIAAGQSGHPVSVVFRGFPPETLAAVWSYLANAAGPNRALHVHGRSEVRKVEKKPESFGLALLHDPKQYGPAAWTIDSARSLSIARPSVVLQQDVCDWDAAPLPHVFLDATPSEVSELMRFFSSARRRTAAPIGANLIAPDSETFETDGCFVGPPPTLNDRRVLFALLCGTCLLRHTRKGEAREPRLEQVDAQYLSEFLDSRGVTTSLSRGVRDSLRRSRLA